MRFPGCGLRERGCGLWAVGCRSEQERLDARVRLDAAIEPQIFAFSLATAYSLQPTARSVSSLATAYSLQPTASSPPGVPQ